MGRVQSPSSIKLYKQCPRKYYYAYILKLPTADNVHTIRGRIAHEVLEDFFDWNPDQLTSMNAEVLAHARVQELLIAKWTAAHAEVRKVMPEKELEITMFEETLLMLLGWSRKFVSRMRATGAPLPDAFRQLTPERELELVDWDLRCKGVIDAVHHTQAGVDIIDYKTSESQDIQEHTLQLAIYALLYTLKHGRQPRRVGINFLKGDEAYLDVDERLLALARREIEDIHSKTASQDKKDYPRCVSRLCKWSSGQCDFYQVCRPDLGID
jgi:RecB family exonuclease